MNGDEVGMVKGIYTNEAEKVILTINLKKPIEIHEGYKLFIGDVGIMGERVVCIENGSQDAPVVNTSDTLPGIYYPGISDMLGKIGELRAFLDNAMLFVDNIQHGTDTARSIIEWLNATEKTIDKIAVSAANTMKGLDDDLPEILNNINNFSDDFNATQLEFSYKLPDILQKTDNIITDCDTLLVKLAKVDDFTADIEGFVEKVDTLDINSINNTLADLNTQIQTIRDEAAKLKLRFVRDKSKKAEQ
jgi:ABC-type transporter Mla subunit MlaD